MLDSLLTGPELDGTTWSVMIAPPSTPPTVHQPDRLLRTASVGKIFALIRTAELITSGDLDPTEPLSRTGAEPVADSGLWQHLRTDALPVTDVATLIGATSDNWGTNVLLQRVGLDSVQQLARNLCTGGSQLWDGVRNQRGPGHPETLSTGCARDFVQLLTAADRGTLINISVSRLLLGWLAPSYDLSMVASAFALDPLAHVPGDADLISWNKTGTDDGVRADVGLVSGPHGTTAYAVLCNYSDPAQVRPVLAAMRRIGERVVESVTTPPKTGTVPKTT